METNLDNHTRQRINGLKKIAPILAGAAIVVGIYETGDRHYTKTDVLPKCDDVAEPKDQNLQHVPANELTQAIGQSAVCKVGEETFRIAVPER